MTGQGTQAQKRDPIVIAASLFIILAGGFLGIGWFGSYQIQREQEAYAARAGTLSRFKMIGMSFAMYIDRSDHRFPPAKNIVELDSQLRPFLMNGVVLKSLNPAGSDVIYNLSMNGSRLPESSTGEEIPLLSEETPWPDSTRVVLFADLHTKRIHTPDWLKLRAKYQWSSGQAGSNE